MLQRYVFFAERAKCFDRIVACFLKKEYLCRVLRTLLPIIIALLCATFFCGCEHKVSSSAGSDSDSVADTTAQDSLSEIIEEEEMPAAADELFDDFFFNFAANRRLQRERTVFPLPVARGGKVSVKERGQWQHEHFFMAQGYYTLIFSDARSVRLAKDTTVSDVTVERIALARGRVTRWHFTRQRGLWRMDSMAVMPLRRHEDAAFLAFYQHFATDSAYQQQALAEEVTFTGPDPDDDYATMTGEILPEQWPSFAPMLPHGTIYNIRYGHAFRPRSATRYFMLRGIANGLQTDLVFTRRGRSWQLTKVNT